MTSWPLQLPPVPLRRGEPFPRPLDLDEFNVLEGSVVLPMMLLKASAMKHNLAVMTAFAKERGFVLAPHGKTTMSPELFTMQLEAGSWGMTVANVVQASVAAKLEAEHLLIANEVVVGAEISWLAEALANDGPELYCLVDSVFGVETLAKGLQRRPEGRRLNVLVELGHPGGRTGCRNAREALTVAEAVRAQPRLRLAGVEGYEGGIASDRRAQSLAAVDEYLLELRGLLLQLVRSGHLPADRPPIVSAGGSVFFDRVVELLRDASVPELSAAHLVIRSGCYLTHDHGYYAQASPFGLGEEETRLRPAIELWAAVLSVPEPGLAIVGMGKRDCAFDLAFPVPLATCAPGSRTVRSIEQAYVGDLDDQHAYLHFAGKAPSVGDRIAFGISHPCTMFDKWGVISVVDDDYQLLDVIETCFH